MACTVNEEHGFTGATGLCRLWSGQPNPIFARQPDAAIVAEPTSLQVVTAHKGMIRWRCRTRGKAAHSSLPELGENAIYRMAAVLSALQNYATKIVGTLAEHPMCGRPTLSVGTITGGVSVNTVPDSCTIEIDRRIVPGEDPIAARQHVIDYLASQLSVPSPRGEGRVRGQNFARTPSPQPSPQGRGSKTLSNTIRHSCTAAD